jgi:hemerythrin
MAWDAVEVELVFEDVVEEDLTVLEVVFDVVDEEVVLTVVEEVFTELDVDFVEEEELLVEVQFPEAGWHPAPQYLMILISIA